MAPKRKELHIDVGDIVTYGDTTVSSIADDSGVSDEFKQWVSDFNGRHLLVSKLVPHENKFKYFLICDGDESEDGFYSEELSLVRKKNQPWDD